MTASLSPARCRRSASSAVRRNASTSTERFASSSQTAFLSAPTKWSWSRRLPGSRTPRTVLRRTDRRFPSGPGLWPGQSASISASRGVGRPRRATRILSRSRALRDCHAPSGTGSPERSTRNRPSDWTTTGGTPVSGMDERDRRAVALRAHLRERRLGAPGRLVVAGEQRAHHRRTRLAGGVAELPPDRLCLRRPPDASRVRFGQRTELERLGERRPVAPAAGLGRGLRRVFGGAGGVTAHERDPAGGEQGLRAVHARPERERPLREPLRLVGVVCRDCPCESGQRRPEALHVAGLLRVPERLLVRHAGQRRVAADPVDLAELLQRVRDHARAEPLVERARHLEVRDRLVEPTEPRERFAPVRQRERAEDREAAEIGEPQRVVELRERLFVRALLDVPRAAVRAHADELEHVAGLLGIVEGAEVMRVVAAAVSLERREHRQHGVGGRKGLCVARPSGDLEGACGIRAARLCVGAQPVRRRAPGEKQRDVAGLARLVGAVVDRHRLVEAASEVEQEAHAPGEGRREPVCTLRRALEAAEGLVPVAADLMRLADELLDGRGSKLGREPARGVEHGVDGSLGEKRAAVGLEQPCRLGGLGGRERPQRLLRLVTALEPPRGGDPHLAHLGSARGEPREGELAHRRAERVPARARGPGARRRGRGAPGNATSRRLLRSRARRRARP